MDASSTPCEREDEEEYVLLDLDGIAGELDIPPNAPYVLSGLDTLNPVLIIDDKFKLIGEYEETIGTCIVFTEQDAAPIVHEVTGPSETNLFSGKCIIDSNQPPTKQVKPVCQLQKVLKFRICSDSEVQDLTAEQSR
ncbi:TFIIIC transcription factor [Quillaja saponaria]|uniref:TFIIIC transcription factor n=1 Tax=Quillaja saponaria TaxID=32244 RepID=A0AAD7PBF2_QUISA|nr:TFIIIC transcription factor [Quillaja saponaria]